MIALPAWGFWLAFVLASGMVITAGASLFLFGRGVVIAVFALCWGSIGALLLIALAQGVTP